MDEGLSPSRVIRQSGRTRTPPSRDAREGYACDENSAATAGGAGGVGAARPGGTKSSPLCLDNSFVSASSEGQGGALGSSVGDVISDVTGEGAEQEGGDDDDEGEGSGTTRLFRKSGDRQLLWAILESENPWGISNQKERCARWLRVAKRIKKGGYVDVCDGEGNRSVHVDICKDVDVSVAVVQKKIKRMWLANKRTFAANEKRALAKTGEGTVSAKDWCTDEEVSEMVQLEQTVRLCAESTETRRSKAPLSRKHQAAAAATRDQSVARMLAAKKGKGAVGRRGGRINPGGQGRGGGRGQGRGGAKKSRGNSNHVDSAAGRPREGGPPNDGEGTGGEGGGDGTALSIASDLEEEDSSGDEAARIESNDARAQALASGSLGRQVREGPGGRKRKPPNSFQDGMDPTEILTVVGNRIMTKMDDDAARATAAGVQDRVIDGLVASQKDLMKQFASLADTIKQDRATPAAPAPAAPAPAAPLPGFNAHHHMAHPYPPANAWYGGHAGVVPPGPPMGIPGVPPGANTYPGSVGVGLPANHGLHHGGIGAGAAAVAAQDGASASSLVQQGTSAGGGGVAPGVQGGRGPVTPLGNCAPIDLRAGGRQPGAHVKPGVPVGNPSVPRAGGIQEEGVSAVAGGVAPVSHVDDGKAHVSTGSASAPVGAGGVAGEGQKVSGGGLGGGGRGSGATKACPSGGGSYRNPIPWKPF